VSFASGFMVALGATSPFARALMMVGSPPLADLYHCGVHDLHPGKPPESKLDGGEGNEAAQSFGKVLEVLGETPVASEPGESALDPPAARPSCRRSA